jgi:hypothetical protein
MANYRTQSNDSFSVGSPPPTISWTVVRGDTSSFIVYVTDDNQDPLTISEWTRKMDIKRNSSVIVSLSPVPAIDASPGEFTVALTAAQSELLQTGDIFDLQLSRVGTVWTVARGSMIIIEDVTD